MSSLLTSVASNYLSDYLLVNIKEHSITLKLILSIIIKRKKIFENQTKEIITLLIGTT